MPCCDKHDRMDTILTNAQYNDFPCGTPTNPDGEQRYCCRKCPSIGQPLAVKAVWVGNPLLLMHLDDQERAAVFAKAKEASLPVDDMLAGANQANAAADPTKSGPRG